MKFAALFTLLILGSATLVTTATAIHDNGASDRLMKRTYTKHATGTLRYTTVNGDEIAKDNPALDECFPLGAGAYRIK
ncbi:hypothetical protein BGZ94_005581 [Podila epigama]|nr:hypothetical protein BGZ94_005581 [Podila epigama]